MSEELKDENIEKMEDSYNDEEIESLNDDLIQAELYKTYPTVDVNTLELDERSMKKGVKEGSYIFAFTNMCKSAGLGNEEILQLLLNQQTLEYNLKMAEWDVKKIKAQNFNVEKNQL
jgi:hypothetical protein